MPTVGELLRSVLGAAGEGIQHQRATEVRGPDYLQRDRAANLAAQSARLQQEGTQRGFQQEDAVAAALAQLARKQGLGTEGQDPRQLAALYQAAIEEAREKRSSRLGEAQASAAEALANQRQKTPEEEQKQREFEAKQALEKDERAFQRALAVARAGASKPQFVVVTDREGNQRVIDKRAQTPGEVIGTRPMNAAEKDKKAMTEVMLQDADRLAGLLDKPEVQEAMGPAAGIGTQIRRATVGVSPEVNDAVRTLDNLVSQLGNIRSGLNMPQQEFERMQRLLATARSNPQTAAQNLALFRSEFGRFLEKRFPGQSSGEAGAAAGGGDDSDPLGILR